MSDEQAHKVEISQDMFPGAYLEPTWTHKEKLEVAPYYAMRLLFRPQICDAPRSHRGYKSIIFEGKEYILSLENYETVTRLKEVLVSSFLVARGYSPQSTNYSLRFNPDVVIDGLKFLHEAAKSMFDIPSNLTTMIWMIPDNGPCGYYRSILPFRHMKEHHADMFYCESHNFLNQDALMWFDAAIMHRYPPNALFAVFQSLKNCGKVMIYEYDDDIFNIPEWNVNAQKITQDVVDRGRLALAASDIVIASTQSLVDISEKEFAFDCPNLIDMKDIGEQLKVDRKVDLSKKGYKPVQKKDRIEFHGPGRRLTQEEAEDGYNAVRILWTGSNTHDHDLDLITIVVKRIIEKYGITVRFFFFGYCPPEFLSVNVSSGNTKKEYVIRPELSHCISFIPPIGMNQYYQQIAVIDPDIAICPLADHVFNMSKSNLKVLEMSAFGIPCVASNIGPYKFLNDEVRCGFTVQDNIDTVTAVRLWIDAISFLIDHPEERQSIGDDARNMVVTKYSWQTDSPNRQKWDTAFARIKETSDSRKKDAELLSS